MVFLKRCYNCCNCSGRRPGAQKDTWVNITDRQDRMRHAEHPQGAQERVWLYPDDPAREPCPRGTAYPRCLLSAKSGVDHVVLYLDCGGFHSPLLLRFNLFPGLFLGLFCLGSLQFQQRANDSRHLTST